MKTEIESKDLLRAFGISTTRPQLARSVHDAETIVAGLARPVAMKIVSRDIVHKVAAGGVRLGVTAESAASAFNSIMQSCAVAMPKAMLDGVLIEEMAQPGVEIFIGARVDAAYGGIVLLGKGGTNVEQMAPPVAALIPLDEAAAHRLVEDTFKNNPIQAELIPALVTCLLAVAGTDGIIASGAAGDVDVNPLILNDVGCLAVDAVVIPLSGELSSRVLSDVQTELALAMRRRRLADIDALFDPASIAFIGASTVTSKLGYRAIRNLLDFGFRGEIYPIHPKAGEICGLTAYPSIRDVPASVDRAYIALSASQVPGALRDCAAKGVKVVQVLTAGFSEWAGEDAAAGSALEADIEEVLSHTDMRMVGPNCIGTFAASSRMAMGAARYCPTKAEGITFISQSGTFAGDVVRRAQVQGIPVARVLSCGNCSDLDLVDYMLFCEGDPATTMVGLYVESIKDPGLFFRLAARMKKPIALLKGGTTEQGLAAAGSHTAALATDQTLWRAAVEQSGVLQVDGIEELMDAFLIQSTHGSLGGKRLGIFGSGGGVSVTCSDIAVRAGMQVPELSTATAAALSRFGVPGTSVANPIDIPVWGLKEGGRPIFGDIVDLLKQDPMVDSVIVYVEMGSIMDFSDSEAEGRAEINAICQSIAGAAKTGPKVSVALRSTGDAIQEDIVREQRIGLFEQGIAVFGSTARAVRAHEKLWRMTGAKGRQGMLAGKTGNLTNPINPQGKE
ncbi:acetate--CoA ligase family protein [Polaromonas sp.]|uniref:acetate--CoA ligase family protein n=1 Tax=Polaromonas sp. TaxID=1869339 RepID=UPI003BAA45A9